MMNNNAFGMGQNNMDPMGNGMGQQQNMMNPMMMNQMNNSGQNMMNPMMMNPMTNSGQNMMNPMMNPMMMGTMVGQNPMMMNPMMMNTMVGQNPMMMNPMMMNTMAGQNQMMMNPMMMNNMGMMNNNQDMMNKMMDILNNNNQDNNDNQDNNINANVNINPNPVPVQVPDLTEQIKKQEEEKKKQLIKQIINQESQGQKSKHCKELEVISDMAVMGSITRGYIEIDRNNNPNKYISTQNALQSNEEYYFVLGILSDYLEKQGVTTAIEKKDQNQLSKEKLKEIDTFLQFLINGLSNLKKHELTFDFGWEKNQLIISNINQQDDFLDELRFALSKGFNIQTNQMVITYPRTSDTGSILVTIAFRTEDFNNITVNQLQQIFQKHAPNLNHLQNIQSHLVLDGILLNPELLDSRGNNLNQGWGVNEKRGGRPYHPPQGWKGYGLRVVKKYDKGNDNWLSYNGGPGEWCVAYHGASQKINHNYTQMRNEDDSNHPGNKVGEGVYCSPKPSVLESDGGIVQVGNKKYKIGFMLRVRPDKIRIAKSNPDYWVLNGNSDEIRPYRILIKNLN